MRKHLTALDFGNHLLGGDDHHVSVLPLGHPFSNPLFGLFILIIVLFVERRRLSQVSDLKFFPSVVYGVVETLQRKCLRSSN